MSDNKIKFEITTPERTVYSGEIDKAIIPTKKGQITVLPGHIPLVASLVPGELRVVKDGEEIFMAVSGGFVEVLARKVVILADSAEHADEIDIEKAEEARKRAQKILEDKHFDAENFAALSAKIEKEMARTKVARKKKYRKLPEA